MDRWSNDEVNKTGGADELELALLRGDGTLLKPVTIGVDDRLYLRSWKGREAAWFRRAQVSHGGRIWVGGVRE